MKLYHTFYSARCRAPGLGNMSIYQIVHHVISSIISTSLPSFARTITCWLVVQVSSLWRRKVSCLFFINNSIGGTLARTSTALVNTVRYAETILSAAPLYGEDNFFWIAWLLRTLAA